MLLLLGGLHPAAAQSASWSSVVAVEKGARKHDQALASLAFALEDWLTGRTGLEQMRKTVSAAKAELASKLALPKSIAARVGVAETGLVGAVSRFTNNQAPDAEAQRALFESLNGYTRDRSLALLEWRSANNNALAGQSKNASQKEFLRWEAAWLPLWKSEVEITYRLQKAYLQTGKAGESVGTGFVRELLAVQAKASSVKAASSLQSLQDLSTRRLTLLARTAEQLDRLGRGESRGAITRVRRLNKEQTDLGRQLQDQRLALLGSLAAKK